MTELILASANQGKLRELRTLLSPLGIALRAQADFGLADTEEPFDTFVENALAKARYASSNTGRPAIADDSGLCVPILDGAPGVLSARWGGDEAGVRSDLANNRKLIRELAGQGNRAAYFYCVLVLVRSGSDPQPIIADGSWFGRILEAPRGDLGFGYDPYFLPDGELLTAAEIDLDVKNLLSHRARAISRLLEKLTETRLLLCSP